MRRSNSNNAGYKDMREAPFYLRADFFPVTEWQGALFFPTKDTEKQEGGSNNVFNNWENAWILVEGAKLNQNWRLNQNQVKCAAETKLLNPVGWSNALFAGSHNLSEEAIWNDKRPGGDIYIPSTTANDVNLGKCLHLFWSSVFIFDILLVASQFLQMMWTLGKICMHCHCSDSPIINYYNLWKSISICHNNSNV